MAYRSKVLRAFAALANRRVDFVAIGDSNQLLSGHGWDHGMQASLSARYPMYATALMSQNENSGNGAGMGYKYARLGVIGASSGAPSQLAAYDTGLYPANYAYLDDAGSFSASSNNGLNIDVDCPIDVNANLRAEYHYGTFPAGTGQLQPAIRRNSSPYNTLANAAVLNPVTGAYGMARADVTLAAAARNFALAVRWASPGLANTDGPFFGSYFRLINTDRTAGFAYHSFAAYGGSPTRVPASAIIAASDTSLSYYFTQIRRVQLQTQSQVYVIVTINEGMNDRNDGANNSVGPTPAAGDTAAGFADNHQAIINRLRAIWTLNGWSHEDELYFVLIPSHPVSNPDDAKLVSYRTAAEAVAAANVNTCAINLERILNFTEMAQGSAGYYTSAGDRAHLSQTGYEQVGTKIVQAIEAVDYVLGDVSNNQNALDLLVSRLTGDRASRIDYLDAAVSSRMATFVYTAPNNAGIGTIVSWLTDANLAFVAIADKVDTVDGVVDAIKSTVDTNLDRKLSQVPGDLLSTVNGDDTVGEQLIYAGSLVVPDPAGGGDIPVDHNTGGADNLRAMYAGEPLDNATIRAYVKADYEAGARPSRPPTTYTRPDGRWIRPLMLNAGEWILIFSKPGVTGDLPVQIEVA